VKQLENSVCHEANIKKMKKKTGILSFVHIQGQNRVSLLCNIIKLPNKMDGRMRKKFRMLAVIL
jgi:hypothetical protein